MNFFLSIFCLASLYLAQGADVGLCDKRGDLRLRIDDLYQEVKLYDQWNFDQICPNTFYNEVKVSSEVNFSEHLIPGMYGTPFYTLPEYTYDQSMLTPLTYETVIAKNSFFRSKENAEQEEKDRLLEIAQDMQGGDLMHTTWRYNVAAAAIIGANIRKAQIDRPCSSKLLLHTATIMQDYLLTELLLKCGADVHEFDEDNCTPIYYAETAELAKLLISYKALENLKDTKKLLFNAVNLCYEPALITVYIDHDLSPMDYDDNYTILMYLAVNRQDHMADKAQRLLQKLSAEEIRCLLAVKYCEMHCSDEDHKDEDVFSIIGYCLAEDAKYHYNYQNELLALASYLKLKQVNMESNIVIEEK